MVKEDDVRTRSFGGDKRKRCMGPNACQAIEAVDVA